MKLLELEVPEIFERLVEIKKIVRIPGYKSKVIVASRDKNIDPVGTCVGQSGSRIRPISSELGGEKIDVIQATDLLQDLVKEALKPAKISRVEIVDKNVAKVWLDEDQRSFAIGKGGQNILLASRLVDLDIQLEQKMLPSEQNLEIEDQFVDSGDDRPDQW
jgi:N utilization substance protein A